MLDKTYLRKTYMQAVREYRAALNEDQQWDARKTMARLERLAIEMHGEDFAKELHALISA